MSFLAGLGLTLAVAAAGLLPPAAAHTELTSSSPTDGARLTKTPEQITLTFSGDIEPRFAKLALTAGGASHALTSQVDGPRIVATVPATTSSNDTWKLDYRVVSTDGHPITGTLSFTVASTNSSTPTPAASSRPSSSAPPAAPASPSAVPTPTPSVAQSLDPRTGLPATDTHGRRKGGWILFALGAAFLVLAPIGVALGGIATPKSHKPTHTQLTSDEPTSEDPKTEEPAVTGEEPRDDR